MKLKDSEIINTSLNERVINDKLSKSVYRAMFFTLVIICLLQFVLIIILQKRQTTEIPYVIEVQENGEAKYIDNAATTLSKYTPSMQTELKVLENFIISLRSVNPDPVIQEERIKKVYAYATEEALKVSKAYLEQTQPQERALKERVEVEVYAATPLYKDKSNIYQLDWNEKTYSLLGELKSESNFRAVINTKIYSVRTKSLQEQNPLGIYLTRLEISKIKDGYVIYEN